MVECYATSCFLHITFLALAHLVGATQHHVSRTCTHGWCYATSCFLHLHTWPVLRNIMGWGGVGMTTFLALAHMAGATQHHVSCTCTHGRCYATSWGGVGWGWQRSLHLHTWSVLRNIMFLALAHMVGATQHHGVGLGWGGDANVPCTCTHGWCYATSCFLHFQRKVWIKMYQNSIHLFRRLVGDEVCKEKRGDNCAESLCAVSKKQLRRTNLNIAVVQDKIEHRYLLSSHFLNKAPGLARIMQAPRCHKMKCMVSPTDACKKPLWQLWHTCSKKKRLTVMLLGPQIHCK